MRQIATTILTVAVFALIAATAAAGAGDIMFDNQYATNAVRPILMRPRPG